VSIFFESMPYRLDESTGRRVMENQHATNDESPPPPPYAYSRR
jgi:hypothetical protein